MRSRAVRDLIRAAVDLSLVENGAGDIKTERATMRLILIILILVLLFGGGFGYSRYGLPRRDRHWRHPADHPDRASFGWPREVLTR
jgi:hypothetical protein